MPYKDLIDEYNINSKIYLGEKPKDIDLATNALPAEVVEIMEKNKIRIINKYGFTHGTVPVRVNENVFEIIKNLVNDL